MISLNMIWPALYISEELWRFWFLVLLTILIETFTIKAILPYTWRKSALASLVGNLVSGFIGTFIMMWAMLFWHFTVDSFLPHATFDKINWIATYVIMCTGSVLIEAFAVSIIFKESIKRLYVALLIGNLMTYAFIAYSMKSSADNDSKEAQQHQHFYKIVPNQFYLLDSTHLNLFSAQMKVNLDDNNEIINDTFPLEIRFDKENPEHFQFELRLVGAAYAGGIQSDYKVIRLDSLMDTVKVVLEQKNPEEGIGWTDPIATDTITFIRQISQGK